MPIFHYKAKKGPEEVIEGKIDAQSEKEAIEKISAMGYLPVQLRQEAGQAAAAGMNAEAVVQEKIRVPGRVITLATRQLSCGR
jgi:type II secretory pathway component PulF